MRFGEEIKSVLDPITAGRIAQTIAETALSGVGVLMVWHQVGFVRRCASRVVFLSEGRVVEEGPPSECLDQPRTDELRDFVSAVRLGW